MKKRILRLIGIGTMTAVLCVFARVQTPMVSRALEHTGTMRLTNYAPLYLDPLEEENNQGTTDAGTGTTVIDPNRGQGDSGTGTSQDSSRQGQGGTGTTQDGTTGSTENAGTGSSQDSSTQGQSGTGTSQEGTGNAGTGTTQQGTGSAGTGTTGSGSGTGSTGAGNGSTNVTVPSNPYTANVNPKDMPATGVEDLRRGVVSLILVLFGIVAILISIPTLKGKRRGDH